LSKLVMSLRVLIVPDKFKGTLTAQAAADAIARGWRKARPGDRLELLPMSDGGDGFGEVLADLLGARRKSVRTVDAAHRPLTAPWWWEPRTKTAIIESAKVVGLALLPRGKFHPFELDTFGLGAALEAAAANGARHILVGIGGSATNDAGFGVARALGWKFFDRAGAAIESWTDLPPLSRAVAPRRKLIRDLRVAVDVQNPLLGVRGCSRIYGPQKGLRKRDFARSEMCLRRLADILARDLGRDDRREPGAGAAGGLGFGLRAFLSARLLPGFDLFATHAALDRRLRMCDVVITGEGALDRSTLMGKGVGEIARRARARGLPCIGLGGVVNDRASLTRLFTETHALAPDLTDGESAMRQAAPWLELLSNRAARSLALL